MPKRWTIKGIVGESLVSYGERLAILKALPNRGRMLEIGTFHGVTMSWLVERKPLARFLCIDNFSAAGCSVTVWMQNLQSHPGVQLFVGTSQEWLEWAKPGRMFDVVLVDGGHGYEDCQTDLRTALAVIKHGGTIFVHDYTAKCFEGIRRAVKDTFSGGWRVREVVDTTAVCRKV